MCNFTIGLPGGKRDNYRYTLFCTIFTYFHQSQKKFKYLLQKGLTNRQRKNYMVLAIPRRIC